MTMTMTADDALLGARFGDRATDFGVWAPRASVCAVRHLDARGHLVGRHPLTRDAHGHWTGRVAGLPLDALYDFEVDARVLPDPRALSLPFGVHGPARLVRSGRPLGHPLPPRRALPSHVQYELHIGTFTREGTFAAAAQKLPAIASLGVTALEVMPVAAFPGTRGWGYDGVALFAPFAPYGTPDDLRAFVDTAHALGLSVWLDVVYNHFGPAGNYLAAFDPAYFTAKLRNAWGEAPDFTYPPMRRLVLDNARHWFVEFGFDGLRLDATHEIHDPSPTHVVSEITALAASLTPPRLVIAEDERNDPDLVADWKIDALWADDFHHTVHVAITRESDGVYAAYRGDTAEIARTIAHGWLYEGQVYPVTGKPRGAPATHLPAEALVYHLQNHDQIGNRGLGERLNALSSLDAYCAASMLLFFLPPSPLLFMGQEWASTSPFFYFTDHEPDIGVKIAAGRLDAFGHFDAFRDPARRAQIPDAQDDAMFVRSKLDWAEAERPPHAQVRELYRQAIALRRTDPVLSASTHRPSVTPQGDALVVRRGHGDMARALLVNFSRAAVPLEGYDGARVVLASRENAWIDGVLAPEAAVVLDPG